MVSKTSTERIIDSSAYMLFYRRRSDVPLGGPNLHRILKRYGDDDDLPGQGGGRRLGEGFSLNGSSSALPGVGASHLPESRGGSSNTALTQHNTHSFEADDKGDDDIPLLASARFQSGRGIEEDEAIELEDTRPSTQPFRGLGTWSFENIPNTAQDSPLDSGAASDEAQHDSSGDERALSSQDDIASSLPGMSEYRLPQPGVDPPSYLDDPATDFLAGSLSSDTNRIRSVTQEIHEVDPNGEQEPLSDDAAEIYLDENDKIKVQ
jgi:ubiquitin carboxyl-terminal hydrolase 4/11/15